MEIDTGAALSVISEDIYKQLRSQGKLPSLKNTEVLLRTYTGEEVSTRALWMSWCFMKVLNTSYPYLWWLE